MPRLGIQLYLAIDVGPIYDGQGKLLAVVETLRDMSSLKKAQDELEKLALHDGLTGIVNRRGFDDKLSMEWSRASRGKCHWHCSWLMSTTSNASTIPMATRLVMNA